MNGNFQQVTIILPQQLTEKINMKAPSEFFGGIEYVRISSLPEDQKALLTKPFPHRSVITILKDSALINDCLLYNYYLEWYESHIHVKYAGVDQHLAA